MDKIQEGIVHMPSPAIRPEAAAGTCTIEMTSTFVEQVALCGISSSVMGPYQLKTFTNLKCARGLRVKGDNMGLLINTERQTAKQWTCTSLLPATIQVVL